MPRTDVPVGQVQLADAQLVGVHDRDGGPILASKAEDGTAIGYCEDCAKTWKLVLHVELTEGR